jgi:hypothetical protein
MEIRSRFFAGVGMFAVLALVQAAPVFAQNHYPLEILNIKPVGAAPNGLDSRNRIYRAYPGIPYNIRAAVIGGAYPYSFQLTGAPSGMTVDGRGEINWTNPSATATPTLTITDSAGNRVSATWTITVSTNGFFFVDAARGRNAANNGCSSSCGTGTLSNPWRTLRDVASNAGSGAVVYFRAGTYNVLDLPRGGIGGVWERVEFGENSRPVIWLEYPGESAVIDFASGPLIRFGGENVWVDGFETRNSSVIGFQFSSGESDRGATFRRLTMHGHGPGGDGTNAAFIMTMSSYPHTAHGMVIQDNTFYDTVTCTLKLYSQNKILVENNTHRDVGEGVAVKADIRRFTVRGDTFINLTNVGVGGNMHGTVGSPDVPTTNGEIAFNNIQSAGDALEINNDSQALQVYIYRNTVRGRLRLKNVDGSDGPFRLSRNVIVNNDSGTPAGSHVYHDNVTAPSRITLDGNLGGYPGDGIVDSAGNLTTAYANYLGTHGHVTGSVVAGPRAPTNLRIMSQ